MTRLTSYINRSNLIFLADADAPVGQGRARCHGQHGAQPADTLRDEMEAGRVDLVIGFLPDLKSGFFQRWLFRQRYVCLFRKGHPLAKSGMTMEGFLEAEHVSIVAERTGHGMVDATMLRAGLPRRVSLRVPHFIAPPGSGPTRAAPTPSPAAATATATAGPHRRTAAHCASRNPAPAGPRQCRRIPTRA